MVTIQDRPNIHADWPQELCIELIREYRHQPALWDQKHIDYYNKIVRDKTWKDIGTKLNKLDDLCRYKHMCLLSTFRRERGLIMKALRNSSEPENIPMSTWFGFKELAFLLDKETERRRQQRFTKSENLEIDMDRIRKIMLKQSKLEAHLNEKSLNSRETFEVQNPHDLLLTKDTKLKDVGEIVIGPIIREDDTVKSKKIDEAEKEIMYFSTYVTAKMKKYASPTKESVKKAIFEVIHKADQDYFEKKHRAKKQNIKEVKE